MSNFTVWWNIYMKLFYDIIHFVHIAATNICPRKQFSVLPKEGNKQDDRNENFHRLYSFVTFNIFLTNYCQKWFFLWNDNLFRIILYRYINIKLKYCQIVKNNILCWCSILPKPITKDNYGCHAGYCMLSKQLSSNLYQWKV